MKLLQLGKIDKGSVLSYGKYKSLSSRWFRSKPKKEGEYNEKKVQASNNLYIEHDSLMSMKCNRGQYESIRHYRVLDIFEKIQQMVCPYI